MTHVDRFVGRYEHALDSKGRLVLPARLRPAFEAGGFLTSGNEGCIALWPNERFQLKLIELETLVEEHPNAQARADERVFSSAEPVTPDVQGRIPIADYLQTFADLQKDRVLIRGANRIVELWNPARWARLEAMAEKKLLGLDAEAS